MQNKKHIRLRPGGGQPDSKRGVGREGGRGGSRGGFLGLQPPQMVMQSCNIKCSTTDVLSHGDALISLAKRLVVVVANF